MTWYQDFDPFDDYGSQGSLNLRAVGWLSRDHPYPIGEVSEIFFEKLCQLLINPWNPVYPAGKHPCDLCQFSHGESISRYRGYQISGLSGAYLFVPAQGILYVSPASINHCIDAHRYTPPQEFFEAVMDCPEMRSMGYLKAVKQAGGMILLEKDRK